MKKADPWEGYYPELMAALGYARIDVVFFYNDRPCLFTCINREYERYIVTLLEERPDLWICAPITPPRLKSLVSGEDDLRDAFLRPRRVRIIGLNIDRRCDPAQYEDVLPEPGVKL